MIECNAVSSPRESRLVLYPIQQTIPENGSRCLNFKELQGASLLLVVKAPAQTFSRANATYFDKTPLRHAEENAFPASLHNQQPLIFPHAKLRQDVEGRKGTNCCLPNIQTYQASDQPARFPRTKQQNQTSPNGNRPAYMSRGWASRNGISRHQDKRATLESFGNAHGTRAVDGSLLIRDKPLLLLCFGHSVIPAYCVAVKMPPACYTWLWLETQ